MALATALLMTGDQSYLNVWREMLDAVNANAVVSDGRPTYPYMYGDAYGEEGWYDFSAGAVCGWGP